MVFQPGSAMLDAFVLSTAENSDTYGYEITQLIQKRFDVSESTLYPVLRRLQASGYLRTYDQPLQGRNRRYYSLTDAGRERLAECRRDWQVYKATVDEILMIGDGAQIEQAEEADESGEE